MMAQEFGLQLALGVIPLSSFLSLPPHLYPSHKLPASQIIDFSDSMELERIQWGSVVVFLSIYLYALLLQDKTYTRYRQTTETYILSVPSLEPCIQSANIHHIKESTNGRKETMLAGEKYIFS